MGSGSGKDDLSQKCQYLLAKSLLNQKKPNDALPVLQKIYGSSSPWAADALFDYAGALSDLGQTQQAADAYRRIYDTYTDSPLREEALYRRAETFWTHGMASQARASASYMRQVMALRASGRSKVTKPTPFSAR